MGRLAVVTGGNKGLGYYIAAQLLAAGHEVIIGCRSAERGQAAASQLGCKFEQLDQADSASIKRFAERLKAQHSAVHILVNNAGTAFKHDDPTPFAEQTRPTLATNAYGLIEVTEALLPLLRAAESPRIVNVASMAGRLKQLGPERQREFTSASLTVPTLKELLGRFEKDVAAGKHRERGWSARCRALPRARAAHPIAPS